ncbi:hypothetical protein Dimus_003616 [Dionaea muscipula]
MQSELGKLFIGGISSETNQDRLREYFSTLGDVGCSGRCDYEGSDNWPCWGIWVCGICWPSGSFLPKEALGLPPPYVLSPLAPGDTLGLVVVPRVNPSSSA